MDHKLQLEAVQEVVANNLAELGVQDPACVVHTFLIRDGFFAGHKFRCEGICAVWPIGTGCVEFRDEDGKLIKTVSLDSAEQEPGASPSPVQKTA